MMGLLCVDDLLLYLYLSTNYQFLAETRAMGPCTRSTRHLEPDGRLVELPQEDAKVGLFALSLQAIVMNLNVVDKSNIDRKVQASYR